MQEAVTKLTGVFQSYASIMVSIDDATGLRLVTNIAATPGRTPYDILDGGVIVPYEWPQDEIDQGWLCFSHLLGLWKARKCVA